MHMTSKLERLPIKAKEKRHQFFNCIFAALLNYIAHLLIYIKCLFQFLFAKLIINQVCALFLSLVHRFFPLMRPTANRKLTLDYATKIIQPKGLFACLHSYFFFACCCCFCCCRINSKSAVCSINRIEKHVLSTGKSSEIKGASKRKRKRKRKRQI